jgi:hypothetical protein
MSINLRPSEEDIPDSFGMMQALIGHYGSDVEVP